MCGIFAVYIRFASEAHEVLISGRGLLKILLMIVVAQASFFLFDLYEFREVRKRGAVYVRTLQALGLTGVRLSCQMLCDHDMAVRAISRLEGSGKKDVGHEPAAEIEPPPVWIDL